MNLKMKLTYKATATVQILDNTRAIFSDEVSPTHKNALSIIEAPNKQELWLKIRALATQHASTTRFAPCIALADANQELHILRDTPKPTTPTNIDDYTL